MIPWLWYGILRLRKNYSSGCGILFWILFGVNLDESNSLSIRKTIVFCHLMNTENDHFTLWYKVEHWIYFQNWITLFWGDGFISQLSLCCREYNMNKITHFSLLLSPQDRFGKLMSLLPELHEIANRGEEHLYHKHCNGGAPTQTLLMEMLHAKRK